MLKRFDELPDFMKNNEVEKYYKILNKKKFHLILKRIFDIVCSTILLILISPVLLALAIAIKIDSKGPVFYRQKRITKYGREFRIFKFRTMVVDADKKGTLVTLKNDSRITRVGNKIRKSRLDELPQLINVLKGDMSLVGPRPFIPGEELPEGEIDPKRYKMRPGLTGLAQINGGRKIAHKQKLKYDVEYYDNMSLWLDLKIILKTLWLLISNDVDE